MNITEPCSKDLSRKTPYRKVNQSPNPKDIFNKENRKKLEELVVFYKVNYILILADIILLIIFPKFLRTAYNVLFQAFHVLVISLYIYVLQKKKPQDWIRQMLIANFLFIILTFLVLVFLFYTKIVKNFFNFFVLVGQKGDQALGYYYLGTMIYFAGNLTFPITGEIVLNKYRKFLLTYTALLEEENIEIPIQKTEETRIDI